MQRADRAPRAAQRRERLLALAPRGVQGDRGLRPAGERGGHVAHRGVGDRDQQQILPAARQSGKGPPPRGRRAPRPRRLRPGGETRPHPAGSHQGED